MLRQPIVSILGHVDHGKTLILDRIRGSAIAAHEAGGITQAIGASIITLATLKKITGNLLTTLKLNITIPGLLFIDTPGHASFVNLRKRGGNLADLAVLVIDINEGLKPQTLESIDILKQAKTPFIVALNKIDLIPGWQHKHDNLIQNINAQQEKTKQHLETKLYEIVGKLYEKGFESERLDRVQDYTKQIVLIPLSAKTGEGTPELLMTLIGMAQRFLEQQLNTDENAPAKGTILEVKEQQGMGTVIDTIIYTGTIKTGDTIVIGGLHEAQVSRVKALLQPATEQEMRDKKTKFATVKQATAATGVRISCPDAQELISGMPIVITRNDTDTQHAKEKVQEEVEEILVQTDNDGIIIKADSLGSLEALSHLLHQHNIPIQKASIGDINKKDISDAEAIHDINPLNALIIGFNVNIQDTSQKVHIITNTIIYRLIDDYNTWIEEQRKKIQLSEMHQLIQPCKIELLKGYVFRQNNPAIVGIEVHNGTLKANTPLMNEEGIPITICKGIQDEQENVDKAERNKRVAISLPGVTVGRQVREMQMLYSDIPEHDFIKYKEYKNYLTEDQKETLKEIAAIKRKTNPVWGI